MTITAIDHVQIAMPAGGEELARSFYVATLGLGEITKPPVLAKRGGCWFEKGEVRIHMGVEADFTPAKKAHVCFVVDSLPQISAKLSINQFIVTPNHDIENVKRIFTQDPFGNRIEIMEAS